MLKLIDNMLKNDITCDSFLPNFELIRRKGTIVSVGNASGPVDPVSPLKLSPKNLKLVRPRSVVILLAPKLWLIGLQYAALRSNF